MDRRKFIAGLGGAVAWPLAARAEQPLRGVRQIGFLAASSSSGGGRHLTECFAAELRNLGWKDGQNIRIDIRWTEGVAENYELFAQQLAASPLDLIVVSGTPGALAAQRFVPDIPIVFVGVSDPVKSGIVASLARPGGHITGVSNFLPATSGKLFELLKRVAPGADNWRALHTLDNAGKLLEVRELQQDGRTLAVAVEPVEVRSPDDFPGAFRKIIELRCDALVTLQEGVTLGARQEIADFARKSRMPTIFQIREFVEAGGLMSYGLNYCRHFGRGATYVDKILKGARPADLPVELPTNFELVINLKTAKLIGIDLPPTLLATADEVIE